jgi:signal peptidase II
MLPDEQTSAAELSTLGAPTAEAAESRGPLVRPSELAVIAAIVLADQMTKALVTARLPLGESYSVFPRWLEFTHVQNTGAAFGFLNDVDFPYKTAVMIALAMLALVALAVYALQLGLHERLARLGMAVVLGGALGNAVGRAAIGHVVDFVDVRWDGIHFWAFNLADAAIWVGAFLVILDVFGVGRPKVSPSP